MGAALPAPHALTRCGQRSHAGAAGARVRRLPLLDPPLLETHAVKPGLLTCTQADSAVLADPTGPVVPGASVRPSDDAGEPPTVTPVPTNTCLPSPASAGTSGMCVGKTI